MSAYPAPPEHIHDWQAQDPEQYLSAEEEALVEEARAFVKSQCFTRLAGRELRGAHVRTETAAGYAADEGMYRSPLVATLCKMMIVEGVPSTVRRATIREFLPRIATVGTRAA